MAEYVHFWIARAVVELGVGLIMAGVFFGSVLLYVLLANRKGRR